MSEQKFFRPSEAREVFALTGPGDFLLPICLPGPDLMMGEDLAIVVLTTIEDQRVGIPMGHQALSDLREIIDEALRMLQAPEGGSVQ
jgi:hypothetical protein